MSAMTKEERNTRRSDLRFQKLYSRHQSWKATVLELWLRAEREGWTHSRLLAERTSRMFDHEGWKTLPQWSKDQLTGSWDVLSDLAYRTKLTFCYPHPETGVITPAHDVCEQGLASLLAEKGLDKHGNHYWRNADGSFSNPY